MAGNTPQHDAWVTDSFGVDPTHYAVNPQGSVPQRANGPDAAPGAPPADDQAGYAAALKAAEADLKTLKGDVIKDDAARIKKDLIDAARAAAAAKDYAGALKLLGQVAKACADARDITARHTAYLQALADAEKALAGLTEPAIVPERDKIKTELIDAARAKIAPPARDYDGAAQLLGQVAARCQAAKGIVGQQAAYETALKAVEDKLAKAAADVSAPEITKIKAECIDPPSCWSRQTSVTTRAPWPCSPRPPSGWTSPTCTSAATRPG